MSGERVILKERYVSGAGLVTSNAENRFGEVWGEYLKGFAGGELIGLYTDYESDFTGKFFFMVGSETGSPDGQTKKIEGGEYIRFDLPSRDQVFSAWQEIWQSNLNRAYTSDFERYLEDGRVEIYIAVKE